MIEARARVVSVEGGSAAVAAEARTGCGGCAESGACGTALIAAWLGGRQGRLRVANPIQAQPGDEVVVGLPERSLAQASRILYGLPLAGLLAGLIAGHEFGAGSELLALWGGLLGLSAGFLGAARRSRTPAGADADQPRLLRRADPEPFRRVSVSR